MSTIFVSQFRSMAAIGLLSGIGFLTFAQSSTSISPNDNCAGPASKLAVTLTRDVKNPQKYFFLVTNKSPEKIISISLGAGVQDQLRASEFMMPLSFESPKNWQASYVFSENSIFMRWVWVAMNDESLILGNSTISGFGFEIPVFQSKQEGNLYADGEVVRRIDVEKIPYRVLFVSGGCAWGLLNIK